jgi:TorA maturation chaperone TorD
MDQGLYIGYAENRSRLYCFLGNFYIKKPDKTFIKELKSKIRKIEKRSAGDLRESLAIVEDSLQGSNMEELSIQLMIEFTRLFRGIKKGYGPPPPYESIYRGERRVIGQVTLDVMQMYQNANFVFSDAYYTGPLDYLGVELQFMAFLCQSEMDAWKNNKDDEAKKYLELEKKFLKLHLLQIVPKFSRNVVQQATEKFYIGVVKLTERFTTMDVDNINFLLKNLSENISNSYT